MFAIGELGMSTGIHSSTQANAPPCLVVLEPSSPLRTTTSTRGDGRQKLFHDQGPYERFTEALEEEVRRCCWIVLSFCWMPNHIHALIQTPQPNLATGMQHWLAVTANRFNLFMT